MDKLVNSEDLVLSLRFFLSSVRIIRVSEDLKQEHVEILLELHYAPRSGQKMLSAVTAQSVTSLSRRLLFLDKMGYIVTKFPSKEDTRKIRRFTGQTNQHASRLYFLTPKGCLLYTSPSPRDS